MSQVLDKAIAAWGEHRGLVTIDIAKYDERVLKVPKRVWLLNERSHFVWLQRALFWLLEKLGCHGWEPTDEITFQRVNFRPQSMIDLLINGMEAAEHPFNRMPTVALIGRKNFMELTRETGQHGAAMALEALTEEVPPYLGHYHFRGRMMNLKLYEVPWMDGILVL